MNVKFRWGRIAALALFGALPLADRSAGQGPQWTPANLRYETNCALSGVDSLDGFVSNIGNDPYVIGGVVRFTFSLAGSMSRPTIQTQGSGTVRPGETARVASTRLPAALAPGETCRFDVKDAIRKAGF